MKKNRQKAISEEQFLVSVILPVYNEYNVLEELYQQIHTALASRNIRKEILFINDGSDEQCSKELDDLSNKYDDVNIISLSRNFGQQSAIYAGFVHGNGDVFAVMDSDLQDSPAAILDFLDKWQEGCDVVYAVRTKRKENIIKRALFYGFYRVMRFAFPIHYPVDAGNFCLMDKKVVHEIRKMPDFCHYFPGLRCWVGFKQGSVTVERGARYDDKPRVNLIGLFKLAKNAVFGFSPLPLLMFYLIAFLAVTALVGVGLFALYHKLFTGQAIPGWTSQLMAVCFFGSLNSLGIAILGEYIWRIYNQVLRRPLFIADRDMLQNESE